VLPETKDYQSSSWCALFLCSAFSCSFQSFSLSAGGSNDLQGRPQILLAGSSIVQAAAGKNW